MRETAFTDAITACEGLAGVISGLSAAGYLYPAIDACVTALREAIKQLDEAMPKRMRGARNLKLLAIAPVLSSLKATNYAMPDDIQALIYDAERRDMLGPWASASTSARP